ncbi:hypothetical protein HK096_006814, partial [Nowakowskiella sp. JEL0078]
MDDSINLRIRCLVHFEQEFFISVSLNTSIAEFKIILSNNFPLKPSPGNQRLIFAGKLLEDKDTIRNILNKSNKGIVPTIHLVLKKVYSHLDSDAILKPSNPQQNIKSANIFINSSEIPLFSPNTTTSEIEKYPFLAKLIKRNIPYQIVRVNGVLCALHQRLNLDLNLNLPVQSSSSLDNHTVLRDSNPRIEPLEQPQPMQPPPAAAAAIPNDEFRDVARGRMQNPVWLTAKLVFIGASQERVFFLSFSAIMIFLFQMGVIQWFVQRLPNVRRHQIPANNQPDPVSNAEPPVNQHQYRLLADLKNVLYTFIVTLIPTQDA